MAELERNETTIQDAHSGKRACMAELEGMDRETKELALLLKIECMEELKEWAEEAALDHDT